MKKNILIVFAFIIVVLGNSIDIEAASTNSYKWIKDYKGWYVQYSDGSYATKEYIDGYWLDEEGYYDDYWDGSWKKDSKGWWFESHSWYPVNEWLKIDGSWYFFDSAGYMAADCWVDRWYVDSSGRWTDTKEDAGPWTITSYATKSGPQSMIYTIEDKYDRLIIIDGGWEGDSTQLNTIIKQHENHVYAWIITHPHPDHVGAFNSLLSQKNSIKIDDIYVTNLNYERYKETAQGYDGFSACEKYYGIIKGMNNVHTLNEGDDVVLLGLEFKVIHGWDDEVNGMNIHLCNNGSLSFIVKGNKDKMLFCADTQKEVEDSIISKYKDELKDVKYIQAGHHGNWGLSTKFYDNIEKPVIVFFDSTDALLSPGSLGYDGGDLKKYFENRGAKVVNYSTAPNSVMVY